MDFIGHNLPWYRHYPRQYTLITRADLNRLTDVSGTLALTRRCRLACSPPGLSVPLLGWRDLKRVQRMLQVGQEDVPLDRGNLEMVVRLLHRASAILLWPAARTVWGQTSSRFPGSAPFSMKVDYGRLWKNLRRILGEEVCRIICRDRGVGHCQLIWWAVIHFPGCRYLLQ